MVSLYYPRSTSKGASGKSLRAAWRRGVTVTVDLTGCGLRPPHHRTRTAASWRSTFLIVITVITSLERRGKTVVVVDKVSAYRSGRLFDLST